jgi:hypothetical protein
MPYEKELFENIVDTKSKVVWVLEKFPETRNSDPELIKRVASQFQLDPFQIAETVRRSRQQFNQAGKYLPTIWEVAKQRKMNQRVWQEALGYKPALF